MPSTAINRRNRWLIILILIVPNRRHNGYGRFLRAAGPNGWQYVPFRQRGPAELLAQAPIEEDREHRDGERGVCRYVPRGKRALCGHLCGSFEPAGGRPGGAERAGLLGVHEEFVPAGRQLYSVQTDLDFVLIRGIGGFSEIPWSAVLEAHKSIPFSYRIFCNFLEKVVQRSMFCTSDSND